MAIKVRMRKSTNVPERCLGRRGRIQAIYIASPADDMHDCKSPVANTIVTNIHGEGNKEVSCWPEEKATFVALLHAHSVIRGGTQDNPRRRRKSFSTAYQ